MIGPNADDLMTLLGNYNGTPAQAITPLEGIRRAVSAKTAVYTAKGCSIAHGVPNLSVVPSDCLRPATSDGLQHGLTAAYYPAAQIEGAPAFTRLDPTVDFIWKNTTPLNGERGDQFGVRWTGYLVPPTSGMYRLGVNGHSGYQLYLDGELLVEYQGVHHALRRTKEVELEAGRLYRIRLDYTNDGIDPWAQLVWAVPGVDETTEALEVAAKADVVVMCLGLTPYVEGEEMPVKVEGFVGGDRTDIALPKAQQTLLERVHALGKPVVLVLLGGSAIAVTWADAARADYPASVVPRRGGRHRPGRHPLRRHQPVRPATGDGLQVGRRPAALQQLRHGEPHLPLFSGRAALSVRPRAELYHVRV